MADLNERGQILLIAAFTLAVTFVALALVVNSAIFTENLASRGEVAGSSEALGYQHEVRQSVGAAMGFANIYNDTDLENSLKESISDFSENGGIQQATGGQLVNVSYVSHVTGHRIADNGSGGTQFLDDGGTLTDWQLAEDVDRTRRIVINVTDDSALENVGGSDPFTLVANESDTSGNSWRMEVFDDSGANEIVIEVDRPGASVEDCRADTFGVSDIEIDVTRGYVNGKRCDALTRTGASGTKMWFASGIPSTSTYNISVENGDMIQGNYSMVIDGGSPNATTVQSGPAAGVPFETDAIYQTTVEYVFVTPNVVYEAEIRVAPGEHP